MLGALLTLLLIATLGFVAVTVVLAAFGMIFGLVFGTLGLAVKALPFLLVGWIVLRLLRGRDGSRRISAADERWLDS